MLSGLSASKANFKITIDSVQNPGEFLLQVAERRSPVGSEVSRGGGDPGPARVCPADVSPSHREEICAFDVRCDCAF